MGLGLRPTFGDKTIYSNSLNCTDKSNEDNFFLKSCISGAQRNTNLFS